MFAGVPGVVIVGGGVAGLEALLALRALAGDRVQLTLVAPETDFQFRPMTVTEPFGRGEARRYPLRSIADDAGARLVRARAAAVEPARRRLVLRSGEELPYETLLLAPGARAEAPFDDAVTFWPPGGVEALRPTIAGVRDGTIGRVAFVAPTRAGWTLPLYELALMTAAERGDGPAEILLVTPEPAPLWAFGPQASEEVARLLEAARVEFVAATSPDVRGGRLLLGSRTVAVDRIVALPLLRGPGLEGVPADPDFGFIPVDDHGRVAGLDGVYAAGDAIDVAIKQGGLAAQQAEAAARHIAARHGAPVAAEPVRAVLRGVLLTGDGRRFLRARDGETALSPEPLWWPPTKVAGRHLAPYLAARDAEAVPGEPPRGFTDVEVPVR